MSEPVTPTNAPSTSKGLASLPYKRPRDEKNSKRAAKKAKLDDSFASSGIGIPGESDVEEESFVANEEEALEEDSDSDSIKFSLAEGAKSEEESDSDDSPPEPLSSPDESSSDDSEEEEEKIRGQNNIPKSGPIFKIEYCDDQNVDMIQHFGASYEIKEKKPSKGGVTKSNKKK